MIEIGRSRSRGASLSMIKIDLSAARSTRRYLWSGLGDGEAMNGLPQELSDLGRSETKLTYRSLVSSSRVLLIIFGLLGAIAF